MYKYYNANAIGKLDEDCTIRAISCATNKSWDYVYEHLSDLAQEHGTMLDNGEFVRDYLNRRYKPVRKLGHTVGETSNLYPHNTLLITMRGHITCSKNGIIYDTWDCTNREVEYAWLVD